MKKISPLIVAILIILGHNSSKAQQINPSEFLPKGYILFEKIYGDVNNDGVEDCILIIKGTDKNNFIKNRFDNIVDRNRRGIIVLLKKNDNYELAVKNYNCFSSENEDGGVYSPPELDIAISQGSLYIGYLHGRYGQRRYTFRFQNSDFELIGYDSSSNHGPIIDSITSINFLTKKKQIKRNINKNKNPEDALSKEIFEETWENIKMDKPIKLSEIEDFEDLINHF